MLWGGRLFERSLNQGITLERQMAMEFSCFLIDRIEKTYRGECWWMWKLRDMCWVIRIDVCKDRPGMTDEQKFEFVIMKMVA